MTDTTITKVAQDTAVELARQDATWGEQKHPDGTGAESKPLFDVDDFLDDDTTAVRLAALFMDRTNARADVGKATWTDILLEQVFEALAEDDPASLRDELVRVAAVAQQWVEAIDRRARG